MQQWSTPQEELIALRTSAARASCEVRYAAEKETPYGTRIFGRVVCPDGWAAARMLLALALEDAATPSARAIALDLRRGAPSDVEFVRSVFDYVKARVRFVREHGEVFARSDYTLAVGAGDCDDHARVVFALLRAGGLPSRLAFLYKPGDRGPRHVAAQAFVNGQWVWLETTVAAALGEDPNVAARRLGVVKSRQDIAGEVKTMTERDLAPLPAGFDAHTNPDQFSLDCAVLERLGYLCEGVDLDRPSNPTFRRAVLDFQKSRMGELRCDGLIGPKTRQALLNCLEQDDLGMAYMASVTGPSKTTHLDAQFFRDVRAMAERFQAKGARASGEDFLAVFNAESGIRASTPNSLGAPYLGLNQMGREQRKAAGFSGSDEEWLGLSATDQLPYVERYFVNATSGNLSLMRDAASLYLLNFLPAFASHGGEPNYVLARRQEDAPAVNASETEWSAYRNANRGDWYAWNRSFDRAKKGYIEVADMGLAVEAAKKGAYWDEVRDRYYSESGDTVPLMAVSSNILGPMLFLGALAAATWWIAGRA